MTSQFGEGRIYVQSLFSFQLSYGQEQRLSFLLIKNKYINKEKMVFEPTEKWNEHLMDDGFSQLHWLVKQLVGTATLSSTII